MYEISISSEVKVEIRDDNQILYRSTNGRIELFLLTAETVGSNHSDGSTGKHVPGPAPSSNMHLYPTNPYLSAVQQFDQSR